MPQCHVARRTALMASRQNTCTDAGDGQSLATKVLHCSFPSFSRGNDGAGRWRLTGDELRIVIGWGSCDWLLTGGVLIRGSLRYPSYRVARTPGRNTAHHFIFGNEMKKDRHKGVI